jgi:hypothetical protein
LQQDQQKDLEELPSYADHVILHMTLWSSAAEAAAEPVIPAAAAEAAEFTTLTIILQFLLLLEILSVEQSQFKLEQGVLLEVPELLAQHL